MQTFVSARGRSLVLLSKVDWNTPHGLASGGAGLCTTPRGAAMELCEGVALASSGLRKSSLTGVSKLSDHGPNPNCHLFLFGFVLLNKVLLEHIHVHLFPYGHVCFSYTMTELNSCERPSGSEKPQIFSLTNRKCLLASSLEDSLHVRTW